MFIWHALFSRFCHRKLRIWSNLLKKFLMENFILCAVTISGKKERPKPTLRQIKWGAQNFFFFNFVSVYEPLIKS